MHILVVRTVVVIFLVTSYILWFMFNKADRLSKLKKVSGIWTAISNIGHFCIFCYVVCGAYGIYDAAVSRTYPLIANRIEVLFVAAFQLLVGSQFIYKKLHIVKRLQNSSSKNLKGKLSIKELAYSAIFMFMYVICAFVAALSAFIYRNSLLFFYAICFANYSATITGYFQIKAIPEEVHKR